MKIHFDNFLQIILTNIFKPNDNPALAPLIEKLGDITIPGNHTSLEDSTFSIFELIKNVAPITPEIRTPYSTYSGSFTTPPCDEVVHWINFLTPIKISSAQLEVFRTLKSHKGQLVNNYRPTQPINEREVLFYY